jgi:hypothetical protein
MTTTYWGAQRLYPKDVKVGDLICIRPSHLGGYYTDAGTVQRAFYGREWSVITSIVKSKGWYTITTDSSTLPVISSAGNAKVFVRRAKGAA